MSHDDKFKFAPSRTVQLLALLGPEMCAQEESVRTLFEKCHEQEEENATLSKRNAALHRENSTLSENNDSLSKRIMNLIGEQNRLQDKISNMELRALDLESELRTSYLQKGQLGLPERLFTYLCGEGSALYRDGKKIQCIKGVREVTGWGLKQSKDFVESLMWALVREGSPYYDRITKEEINSACVDAGIERVFHHID
jgi:hypothetical protein